MKERIYDLEVTLKEFINKSQEQTVKIEKSNGRINKIENILNKSKIIYE